MELVRVAVLDDYQGAALNAADWSRLEGRIELTVFHDHLSDPARIVARLAPYDVVCVMRERTPLPSAILEQLPRLKLLVSTGARNAAIDVEAAKARGIIVCNTGYSEHGAMEMTWALILGAIRNLPKEAASLRSGGWQLTIAGDLKGRVLGVVGLGRIGGAVARVAAAFGMEVIAWSQNLTDEKARALGARRVEKRELFTNSDIVTLHLLLSKRTRGIVGSDEFALMKSQAWIINTSRGPLIDERALVEVLERRRIKGAALDVFDIEPLPPGHRLRELDNVIATPHCGFVTEETYRIFYGDTVENIVAWLDGTPVRAV
jgi:phosphoglycerate dehydrogenase-like enzyme